MSPVSKLDVNYSNPADFTVFRIKCLESNQNAQKYRRDLKQCTGI